MGDPFGLRIIESAFVPPGMIYVLPNAAPFNLPNTMSLPPRPKTSLPDVIYQHDFSTGRWQYKFDQPGSDWMNSNTLRTGDDECLTRVRQGFPERHIRFTHDPRTGRRLSPLSTMIFTAWDLDKPFPAVDVTPKSSVTVKVADSVTYRYNAQLQQWEFTWPNVSGAWYKSDYLNSDKKADPFILTDEQLAQLKADWPDTEVIVEPLVSGTTYYRFAQNRWEYFSRRYKGWRESNVYAGLSLDEGLPRVQRDAVADQRLSPGYSVVITTINGVRFDVWKQDQTYARAAGAIFGEPFMSGRANYPGAPIPVSSPLTYPDIGRVTGRNISAPSALGAPYSRAQERADAQAYNYAAMYGMPGTHTEDRVADSVLAKTERHRFNRVHLGQPAIPLNREWLNGAGDLIDLKLVDNEHLRNIVNMVMRGARVGGQKIERTPERVRQGLNAAAEQAERMERFEYAKVKAEVGEKAVRNEALSFLNSLRSLKRLVDPTEVPSNGAKAAK